MSLFSHLANFLRPNRLIREIDEELESHIAEAIAEGRDPQEVRRTFGSRLRLREESRARGRPVPAAEQAVAAA